MRKLILPKPTGLVVPERRIFIPRGPSRYRQRGFMRLMPSMGLWWRSPLISVDAADFPGDLSNFMTRGASLTGAADSKTGILSAWYRFDVNQTSTVTAMPTAIGGSTVRFLSQWTGGGGAVLIRGWNSAGTIILDIATNSVFSSGATWRNFLASWDLAATTVHFYVNDVSDISATQTKTNDTLDYTVADCVIGRFSSASNGFNGCMAEFYFAPGQYLDFSVEANRRKYISANGKPVDLGLDGSKPTGTPALVYQHLQKGEAVANFATNRGTGGNFTITGTLGAASTSPSD